MLAPNCTQLSGDFDFYNDPSKISEESQFSGSKDSNFNKKTRVKWIKFLESSFQRTKFKLYFTHDFFSPLATS